MADPTPYTPGYDFSAFQVGNPNRPLPGDRVDTELADIAEALGQTIDGLKDIRRSDGKLKNGIVDGDAMVLGGVAAGAAIVWDGAKFISGPRADEITNAQGYAEAAEEAAAQVNLGALEQAVAQTGADRLAAQTSATAASTSATAASTSATAASTSATAASTSATAASTSAASAAAAAAAAQSVVGSAHGHSGFLGSNGNWNFAKGASEPAGQFWEASAVRGGLTITRTATGQDASGEWWGEFAVSGVLSAGSVEIGYISVAGSQINVAAGEAYVASAWLTITGTDKGDGVRVIMRDTVARNGNTVTAGPEISIINRTLTSGVTTNRCAVIIAGTIGQTINCTVRIQGLQFERGLVRTQGQFKELTTPETLAVLGAPIDPSTGRFGWAYTSSEIAIVNGGSTTMSHGLGRVPREVAVSLICKTAEYQFTVGQEVPVPMAAISTSAYNAVAASDATNIVVQVASNGFMALGTTGLPIPLTAANWRILVRAR